MALHPSVSDLAKTVRVHCNILEKNKYRKKRKK